MTKRRPKYFRIFLALFILILLVYFFISSSIFDIRTIEIQGNKEVDKQTIREKAQITSGDSILFINKEAIKNNIKKIAKIEDVSIHRRPIGRLIINVEERKPVAYIETKEDYLIIDRNAVYYKNSSKEPDDLCEISGLKNTGKLEISSSLIDLADQGQDQLLVEIFSNEDYLNYDQIRLKKDSCEILLKNQVLVKFGSYSDIEYKLAVINEMIKKISEDESGHKASMILLEEGKDPILVYE